MYIHIHIHVHTCTCTCIFLDHNYIKVSISIYFYLQYCANSAYEISRTVQKAERKTKIKGKKRRKEKKLTTQNKTIQ